MKAAFGNTERITVYDEAHLPLIRKRRDDLTRAERRMTPAVGHLKTDDLGDTICVPDARNSQHRAHLELLTDVAGLLGVEATIPRAGRPRNLAILRFIDGRPSGVPLGRAVEQAAEQLRWNSDSVRRAYYRAKKARDQPRDQRSR